MASRSRSNVEDLREVDENTNESHTHANKAFLDSIDEFTIQSITPVATVICNASNNAPDGYLYCNGQAVDRTTYSSLFSAIGTTYGVGNGSTTFNIPDLRGEFIRGYDDGRGVDDGRLLGSLQEDAIRNITGELGYVRISTSSTSRTSGAFIRSATATIDGDGGEARSGGAYSFDASRVVPTADDNRPRNIAMKYYIKY